MQGNSDFVRLIAEPLLRRFGDGKAWELASLDRGSQTNNDSFSDDDKQHT